MPETLCPLHQESLVSELTEIAYGTPIFAPDFMEARADLFPNSRLRVLGGGIVQNHKHERIMCCWSCRAAEKIWTDLRNRPFSESFE